MDLPEEFTDAINAKRKVEATIKKEEYDELERKNTS